MTRNDLDQLFVDAKLEGDTTLYFMLGGTYIEVGEIEVVTSLEDEQCATLKFTKN